MLKFTIPSILNTVDDEDDMDAAWQEWKDYEASLGPDYHRSDCPVPDPTKPDDTCSCLDRAGLKWIAENANRFRIFKT